MRFLILLLVAATLAGCSEDPASQSCVEDEDDCGPGVIVTSTTGGVRGVVVDQAIVPINGAIVAVVGTEKATTTDEDGIFVISGLPAGAIFLDVAHPLYAPTQMGTDVVAGEENPPMLRIQLQRVIDTDPYMETISMQGHVVCSTNLDEVGYSEECGEGAGMPYGTCDWRPLGLPPEEACVDNPVMPGERVGRQDGSTPQLWFRVGGEDVATILVEQVWEPSLSLATGNTEAFYTRLAANWFCTPFCGGDTIATITAESPLLLRADSEQLRAAEEAMNVTIGPETDLSTFVYSGAENGVILEQGYEQFVTVFYALEAPQDWSFVAGSTNPYA